MKILSYISNFINDIKIHNEAEKFLFSGVWKDVDTLHIDGDCDYREIRGYHVFIFDAQKYMIENGIVEKEFDRYDISKDFEQWMSENMRGYYDIRAWGNGRGNWRQVDWGIWHVQIWIVREIDAFAFKLRWM